MGVVGLVLDFILDIGVVTAALIGLIFTLIVLRMTRYRKYKLPPGPPGYPLLGNLRALKGKEPHKQFAEWSKEYGPVLSVYLGPQLNIVLNNIEVVLEALVKKQNDFAGRPKSVTIDMMSDGGRSIVFGEGPTWKLHRRLSSKAIRQFMRGATLEEKLHSNFAALREIIIKEKGPVDPTEYVLLVVISTVCGVCFGHSYDFEDAEFKKIANAFKSFSDGSIDASGFFLEDVIPLLHRCPTKGFKKISAIVDWFFDFIQMKIVQHRKSLDPENIRDLTDAILVAQSEEEPEDGDEASSLITDRHVVQTISDIFGAGIDTTRLTITYALKYMAAYPDVQRKVVDEIENVVGCDRLPGLSDKDNLPYTDAVLHEVMRLHPVVPLAIPHKTTCDTSVGGFDVPKDTQVLVNLWALHRDTEQWEDVDEFRPERFLDESGKMAPKPKSWLSFSAGRRVCLGEAVAKPELVLLLASFIQQFKVRFPDGTKPNMTDLVLLTGISPKPFELIFEERHSGKGL